MTASDFELTADEARLAGEMVVPDRAGGLVLFAHGSGSSRHSPRNQAVAATLQRKGFATVLFDMLSEAEEPAEAPGHGRRFDIELLHRRLAIAVEQLETDERTTGLPCGLFGASTGAAAALSVAAALPERIGAVVSRGGRPDLAGQALARVRAPVLLLVGGNDPQVRELNEQAADRLTAPHELSVVPGATHLFEEPGHWNRSPRRPRAGSPSTCGRADRSGC